MKSFITKIRISCLVLLSFSFLPNEVSAQCSFPTSMYMYSYDSCPYAPEIGYHVSVYDSSTTYSFEWKVNGNIDSNSSGGSNYSTLNIGNLANGSYYTCVTITDDSTNCDTTLCILDSMYCASTPCNWSGKINSSGSYDSCPLIPKISTYVYMDSSSTYSFEWKVDGNTKSSSGGGSYNSYLENSYQDNNWHNTCVTITDDSTNCDTTLCFLDRVACGANNCNWNDKIRYASSYDSCPRAPIISSSVTMDYSSTFSFEWKVNGKTKTGYSSGPFSSLDQHTLANGSYYTCIKITDDSSTCGDTTICFYDSITCGTSNCNWNGKINSSGSYDSCPLVPKISSYIYMDSSSTYTFEWKVNGSTKTSSGGGSYNSYLDQNNLFNGSYYTCVKITDDSSTCGDTTICFNDSITCGANNCNWNDKILSTWQGDSCTGTGAEVSTAVYMKSGFSGSFAWKVNGQAVQGIRNTLFRNSVPNGPITICVTITEDSSTCADTTICFYDSINCQTSSLKLIGEFEGGVYPNPTNGILFLDGLKETQQKVQIFTTTGILIDEQKITNQSINLNHLATGLYQVHIIDSENLRQTFKVQRF